ncbi:MAG TPA: RHS repeat-associated core domain-containing protein [Chitinophaga sp.]|uniref:RHS repeat-associated core domain-containing protein n=1 Tax=Chitinophaga sp. TaxID=1869181 RepID=UPI002DB8D1F1|nr:RHS repeat-associated core domain-containing protein [Chitinophaga sp.]HEU4553601.1 RHS repeat-associated core domain-containing protein [Chitinophaga sp.]
MLVTLAGESHAQTGTGIVFKKVLDGSKGQLAKDSMAAIQDSAYFSATLQDKLDTPYQVTNVITFKINEYSPLYLPVQFTAKVDVRIIYTTPGLVVDSIDRTLDINYDTAHAYMARNSFLFSNAHKVSIKILSVTVSVPDVLPALMLENEMQVRPVYKLSCVDDAVKSFTTVNPENTDETDEINVSWPAATGADEYDLEWAYIDSSALARYGTPPTPRLLFENNATRVTISANNYAIPLIYDNGGVLFYRVRAVQDKEHNSRLETAWSSDFTGGLGSFNFMGHQRHLNWQSDVSYAEEGKRKVVVQYFDGSLRSRQTVTKDNSTNTTLVGESYYDYQGRPVLQVMPAPTLSNIIKYSRDFNTDINGAEYDKDKYDHLNDPSEFMDASAAEMGGGASTYYSANNPDPDKNTGISRYIPDAQKYPFTETSYTQDNTGRISRQGGLGPVYKLGSDHETKYYYGAPGDNDLDAMFGTEAGGKSHYFKNIMRDANGQYSVSYLDMHGRTIATALAGMPANADMAPLPSYAVYENTDVLSGPGKNTVEGLVMESRQSQVVTMEDNYNFNYTLAPPVLTIKDCNGNDVCYNGLYDLEITITGDGYSQGLPNKKPFEKLVLNYTVGAINPSVCGQPGQAFNVPFTVHLKEGSYEITKRLIISQEGLDYYRNNVFGPANLCKTLDDFIQQQRSLVNDLECVPNCAACLSQLGTLDDFRQKYVNSVKPEGAPADFENDVQAAYQSAMESCNALCGKSSETDDIRQAMLMDMSAPSGQYANIDKIDQYSIFYTTGDAHPRAYQDETLVYRDEAGKPDLVYDERFGAYVTPQKLIPEQFAAKFKPSWAATLLPLHPEYCKLLELEKYKNSYSWDGAFESVDTYAEAKAAGYLNPTGGVTGPFVNYPANGKDALLQDWPDLQSELENKMENYVVASDGTFNIWSVAVASIKCKEGDNGCKVAYQNARPAFDENALCTGDLDMAWRAFRGIYLQIKHDMLNSKVTNACNQPELARDLSSAGKQPHFNIAADAISDQQLPYMDINNTDPNAGRAAANAALQQAIADNCNAYTEYWLQQLAPCQYGTAAWDEIKAKLVQVCKEGGDQDHPFGASTVKPSSTYYYRSFEQVLKEYNDQHPANPLICNPELITVPKPYDRQPAYAENVSYTKPADCECAKLKELRQEYESNRMPSDVDMPAYLLRTRQIHISAADLQKLFDGCSSAGSACKYLSAPLKIPVWMQCNVAPACATCSVVNALYANYKALYPDALPTVSDDGENQPQKNQLFANYMNNHLGFARQAWEYIQFMDSCTKVSSRDTTVCTPSQQMRTYSAYTGGQQTSFAGSAVGGAVASSTDVFSDFKKTADGGYIIAGYTVGIGNGGKDAFIVKTDNQGNYQWAKTYGGAGNDEFVKIKSAPYGGYVAIGNTNSFNSGKSEIFVVKIDEAGNVQWSQSLGFGSAAGEEAMDVITTSDGGYAFSGKYNSPSENVDWLIGTLDASGNLGWVKHAGSINSDPVVMLLEDDSLLIAAGSVRYTGATNYDAVVMKIRKSDGVIKSYSGYDLNGRTNWVNAIHKTQEGYKITLLEASGWNNEDGKGNILDIDTSGNVISAKVLSGDYGNWMAWLPVYYTAGNNIITMPAMVQNQEIYAYKINSTNTGLDWDNRIQQTGNQQISAVIQNSDGSIAAVGKYENRGLFMLTNALGRTACTDTSFTATYTNAIVVKRDFTLNQDELLPSTNHLILVTPGIPGIADSTLKCPGSDTCYAFNNGPLLCNGTEPVFPAISIDNSCSDNDFFVISTATEMYKAYKDSVLGTFDRDYINTALQAANLENFTVTYHTSEYHYTLYYYDQAGNLVKTIPPAGAVVDRSENWLNQVRTARANGDQKTPDHKMATEYHYNTLNQVVAQHTPDGGDSRFWYDRLGRLAVSQNAKQLTDDAYSYTLYDPLGRITEVGEIISTEAMSDAVSRNDAQLSGWLNRAAANKTQVTRTVYDLPYTPLEGDESGHVLIATNLRNRVSWSALYNSADKLATGDYEAGTFYSYDIHGNVETLLQDFKADGGIMRTTGNRWKKIKYHYDLISGKVNEVDYQPGEPDAFYHRYTYDAENRLTNVATSRDNIYWENDAYYQYYKHGPLARMILGQQQVQGIDYAYTLQGWLKGVNSTAMTPEFDMGADGGPGSIVARDAFGFALHYYGNGDYTPIKQGLKPFAAASDAGTNFKPLFNGNISAMSVNIPSLGEPLLYAYNYDVLNRLKGMNALHTLNTSTNTWTPSLLDDFKEDVSYDANGNILSYLRNGSPLFAGKSIEMDNLTYSYISGTNKLSSINDAAHDGDYGNDIKSQGEGNYTYDAIGNLTHDEQANIDNIEWTVYGKIRKIKKSNNTDIVYTYDAAGNRISKDVNGQQTWYVRDATGNILSVYTSKDATVNNGDLSQTETELYGSSRLGMSTLATNVEHRDVPSTTTIPGLGEGKNVIFTRGNKIFELSNHLGNVLATVSDEKRPVSLDGTTIDHYEAKLTSAQDYYPFGMLMPGRNGHHIAGGWSSGSSVVNGYTVPESLSLGSRTDNQPGEYTASQTINFVEGFSSGVKDEFNATIADDSYSGGSSETGDGSSVAMSGYRYGFNGKENDNEVKGEGNQQDYGMRIYDPRVGRFLSVDPLAMKYAGQTVYAFSANSPIRFVDVFGMEPGDPPLSLWMQFRVAMYKATKFVLDGRLTAWTDLGRQRQNALVNTAMASTLGTVNGAATHLTFGIYSRSAESLGINEEYAAAYNRGSQVGAAAPIPGLGSAGTSPTLAVARSESVVIKTVVPQIQIVSTLLASGENGTNEVHGTNGSSNPSSGVEKRRLAFERNSPNWARGSLKDAIKRFAPGIEGVVSEDGVKTRYTNPQTNIQIIADNENNYFRIFNRNTNQYLETNGRVPSTAGRSGMEAKDYVQRQTHILNQD